MRKTGIYIHIPFCLRKCPYCDFYSVAAHDNDLRKDFVGALIKEIQASGRKYGKNSDSPMTADTIYFGGGTPSLLEPEEIQVILAGIRDNFAIEKDAEISLECNPATADEEKLKDFRRAGVNRISIGAQSFDDEVLKTLGRLHDVQEIIEAVDLARKAGFDNISLDLMFAIPGQTEKIWEETLKQALSLNPQHISFYSLEFMEGTPFTRRMEKGLITETDAEDDRRMYERGLEILAEAGFSQYEISNAVRGEEYICRHNMKYWSLGEYLGFGPSAHSYVTGEQGRGLRFSNAADVAAYIEAVERGESAIEDFCRNSLEDDVSEYVFTGLRKNRGIDLRDFRKKFGSVIWEFYGKDVREEFEEFVRSGFADETEDNIKLTIKGMNISNRIMALFV